MLRLIDLSQPTWLDLGYGVEIEVRPFNTALMLEIRAALRQEVVSGDFDADLADHEKGRRFTRAAAMLAIRDWRGVGNEAGEPISCTPDGVSALMDIYQIHEAFERLYVQPRIVLDAEKNGSSPGQNGTSARVEEATTAEGATAPAPSARTH